jgi:hypothetical protein
MRTFIGLPFTCCLIGLDPPNQVLVPLFRHWQLLLLCTKFLYNPCSPNPYTIRAPLCSPIRNRYRHNHRYSRHYNYHYRSYR